MSSDCEELLRGFAVGIRFSTHSKLKAYEATYAFVILKLDNSYISKLQNEVRCNMWSDKAVLVTGGASFIGSHLVDKLLKLGANVQIADDLSSGRMENLEHKLRFDERKKCWIGEGIKFFKGDLKDKCFTKMVMEGIDRVFHLAALHGGRGYITTHPAECCSNMILDQLVFETARDMGVERICFASSACVYPTFLQEDASAGYLLKEEDADPFIQGKSFADLEYGWAKLMGEMALRAYHKEYGMKTSSVRIFTAYGPRENETHAVIALIAKAFVEMDPYIVWGTGEQDRNFTYVEDIVDALILAAERINDGTPVNAGLSEHIKINDVCEKIFEYTGFRPRKIVFDTSKPQGVISRAADLTRAKRLLSWQPKVSFDEGLRRTIDWYFSTKNKEKILKKLDQLLLEHQYKRVEVTV
jgi:UDP-glucose 4-epimerase